MGKTNYYAIDGEIIAERTVGQARLDYVPDALGTVTKTIDQTKTVQFTGALFTPYGVALNSVPSTPRFTYVGAPGYQNATGAGMAYADYFIRDRFLRASSGTWITVDRFWPNQRPYAYALCNPTIYVDVDGQSPQKQPKKQHNKKRPNLYPFKYPGAKNCLSMDDIHSKVFKMVSQLYPHGKPRDLNLISVLITCLAWNECEGGDANNVTKNNFGLFNYGDSDFDACAPAGCEGKYWDPDCQVAAQGNLMSDLCSRSNGANLYQSIAPYFGTLPSANRDDQINQNFFQCLQRYHLVKEKEWPMVSPKSDVPYALFMLPCPANADMQEP